jgi:hypothetical protein
MQRAEGIHQPNLINRLTFRFAQSGRAEYERQPQPDERCSEWFTTNSIQSLFAAVGTNLGPALGFVEVAEPDHRHVLPAIVTSGIHVGTRVQKGCDVL